MKFEVLPPVEDVELRGHDSKRELPDNEELNRQLQEASRAAGSEEVQAALEQVMVGEAKPEALLAWMDELRDPEERHVEVDPAELQEGFVPDFIADTKMAGGTLDLHDPTGEQKDSMFFAAAKQSGEVGAVDSDADADYFLSVIKKRRGDPDDSDEGGTEENAPKQKKSESKPKTASKKRGH